MYIGLGLVLEHADHVYVYYVSELIFSLILCSLLIWSHSVWQCFWIRKAQWDASCSKAEFKEVGFYGWCHIINLPSLFNLRMSRCRIASAAFVVVSVTFKSVLAPCLANGICGSQPSRWCFQCLLNWLIELFFKNSCVHVCVINSDNPPNNTAFCALYYFIVKVCAQWMGYREYTCIFYLFLNFN